MQALREIILVPRNGLGNRLQAWASSAILAAEWNVPLRIVWEKEQAAPASFEDLFAGMPHGVEMEQDLMARVGLDKRLGQRHEDLPRYLWSDPARELVVLAGHDRGEQAFMPDLNRLLGAADEPFTLLIIAGGLFDASSPVSSGGSEFVRKRQAFYRSLHWSQSIIYAVDLSSPKDSYSSLHIRLTDRSHQAPTTQKITDALKQMRNRTASRSLFIAGDTPQARAWWTDRSRDLGFTPWSLPQTDFSRSTVGGALGAAADWVALSRTSGGIVYPRASTFSAEAAVAAGCPEFGLTAARYLQELRRVQGHAGNVVRRVMGSRAS